ncbi:TRIM71 [Acanthosepion pharaonis]|uniref:TRIM71 n=1 Tax=Acanthosepion pharaonis TaxID=158019 RepID=A0A812CRX3_ACAPH|nr:TRIM71 [Sepia pharaonis]
MATALDVLLTCHLCSERIDNEHRMLPCRHSFCEACIVDHFEKKFHQNNIRTPSVPDKKCPTCSASLSIFNMEIESVEERLQQAVKHLNIDENITHLLKLANEQQKQKQSQNYRHPQQEQDHEPSGETYENKCGPCNKKNKNISAIDYCGECDKYFCESCLTCHEDLFSDHVVVSGSVCASLNGAISDDGDDADGVSVEKSILMCRSCPIHQLPDNYFCKNCRESLCASCCQDHTACGPPVPLDSHLVNEERQKAERLLQKANQLQRDVEKFADKTKRRMKELNNQCREKKDEIMIRVERVTSALREQAWQVIADLETSKKVQNSLLNKKLIFCDGVKEQVRDLKRDYSEIKSTRGSDGYLLSCYKDMDLKWTRIESETRQEMGLGSDVDIRVHYSEDFMDILGKLASLRLGHLEFVSTVEPQYLSPERFRLVDVATQCVPSTLDVGTQYFFSNDILSVPKLTQIKDSLLEEIAIDISGVTLTGDGYMLMCYFWEKMIYVYNTDGVLRCHCRIPGHPYDICKLSETEFIVMLPDLCRILFLESCEDRKVLRETKLVSTYRKEYVSVCKVGEAILVCDTHTNVDMLSPEGVILSSVLSERHRTDGLHKIIPGISGTFWLLDRSIAIISCYHLEGTLLVSHLPTQDGSVCSTDDICFDDAGYMYCCNKGKVFCITPQETVSILWKFDCKFLKPSRLLLTSSQDQLLLICKNGQKYQIITFQISKSHEQS